MKLIVNPSVTVKELVNEALSFAKYPNDIEAMEHLNDVMIELKYSMSTGNFQIFKDRINTMLNA